MGEFDKRITLWLRRALALLFALLAFAFLFFFFFDLILPFTAAFLVALLLSPLTRRLGKKTRMSPRYLRVFLLFLLMGLLSLLLTLALIRLFGEAKDFFLTLYGSLDSILASFFSVIERLKDKLKLESVNTEGLSLLFSDAFHNVMAEISSRSASAAAHLAARLPSLLFALLLFVIALFYFSLDYDRITSYLTSLLPPRFRPTLDKLKQAFFSALGRYCKAYFLLFLITFAELFLAFVLLRVEYAFLVALLTAVLDILPAIGIGIVLIPWALFHLISGQIGRAVALLVLYLIMTLLRQILEPHIIGAHFGLHPLASLVALYLGFRTLGVLGILLSPLLAFAFVKLLSLWRQKMQKDSVPPSSA